MSGTATVTSSITPIANRSRSRACRDRHQPRRHDRRDHGTPRSSLVCGRPVPPRVQIEADQGPSAVSRFHRRGSAQAREQPGRSGALGDESRRPRFPRRELARARRARRADIERFDPIDGPERPEPEDDWVAPAFWDIQVNGRWGHSFSSPDLTVEQVAAIVRAQGPLGTARLCPTLITAPTGSPDSWGSHDRRGL